LFVIDASKGNGLVAKVQKTEYLIKFLKRNIKRNQIAKTTKDPFENVEKFKYFGTKSIISISFMGKIRANSVQIILYSLLLSRNVKIRTYKTIILSVILYEFEIDL
jgi:hypothetical protein